MINRSFGLSLLIAFYLSGLNSTGAAVNTGVYLVFVSNDGKSKQQVGKIAIVK